MTIHFMHCLCIVSISSYWIQVCLFQNARKDFYVHFKFSTIFFEFFHPSVLYDYLASCLICLTSWSFSVHFNNLKRILFNLSKCVGVGCVCVWGAWVIPPTSFHMRVATSVSKKWHLSIDEVFNMFAVMINSM